MTSFYTEKELDLKRCGKNQFRRFYFKIQIEKCEQHQQSIKKIDR
jgi:hypothetical protein